MQKENYKLNERKFHDIEQFFSEDYRHCRFDCPQDKIVYVGYESRKLPNITRILDLDTADGEIVMGSTMGHQHTQKENGDKREFQEIYEFLSYGGMFVRNKEAVLYLLSPREKVVVGTDDDMTLLNFESFVLTTHDFADKNRNSASKELEKRIGTCLLVKYMRKICGFSFHINPKYYEEKLLAGRDLGPIVIENVPFGIGLYRKMLNAETEFAKRGIRVVLGGNLPEDLQRISQIPLSILAQEKDNLLFEALQIPKQIIK